eukprot:TRINITY_DN10807_c0_g1_i1.p1 TRINITY_DN10807_c0_g1~~TRINITY_DN10807_c0_g1_i1.p1  ORF type:complete len:1868 (+),score=498.60 TRINITY_DN10807_c0_g1_i1:73-5604(+)
MAGNAVVNRSTGQAMRVLGFTADNIAPSVIGATLDMDAGQLRLNFSETVRATAAAMTVADVTLFHPIELTEAVRLSGGDVTDAFTDQVIVTLIEEDMNALRRRTSLAISQADVRMTIARSFVADMQGTPMQIVLDRALETFVPDVTKPVVRAARLNMDLGQLQLSFSETVDPRTLDASSITVASAGDDSLGGYVSFRLTGGSSGSMIGEEVHLQLSIEDMDQIKARRTLAVSMASSYLVIAAEAIQDMAGNGLALLEGFAMTNYTADQTPINVVSFVLDMEQSRLLVTVDETLDDASIDVTGLTLINAQSIASASASHTLSSLSMGARGNLTQVVINLSVSDMNELKRLSALATSELDTYLVVASSFVSDTAGNDVVGLEGLQAANVVQDPIAPEVVSVALDMNAESLTLSFDEVVDASTLEPRAVTIQSRASESESSSIYTLTGGSTDSQDSLEIVIDLAQADVDELTALSVLATSVNNTFVSFGSLLIADMSGNAVVAVSNTSAVRVGAFVKDTTAAQLTRFTIDMDASRIELTFVETMYGGSGDATALTLHGDSSGVKASVTLSHQSQVEAVNGTVVGLNIDRLDMNEIKAKTALCTTEANCYIGLTSALMMDMAGNRVVAIASSAGQQAAELTEDSTPPELLLMELDLTLEELYLRFDETVNGAAVDVTLGGFELIPSATSESNAGPVIELRAGNVSQPSHTELIIKLDTIDLHDIKLSDEIGISLATTAIRLSSGVIEDMSGNGIEMVELNGTSFERDNIAPQLEAVDVDVNGSQVILNFDEPVRVSELRVEELVAMSSLMGNVSVDGVALSSGESAARVGSVNGRQVVIDVSLGDLNRIKQREDIWASTSTAVVAIGRGLIKDMAGNPVAATIVLGQYEADTTAPQLRAWSLDMDAGVLVLSFRETIDASTLRATDLTLMAQESPSGPNAHLLQHTLTAGQVTAPAVNEADQTQVELTLVRADMDVLKTKGIGAMRSRSWLSASAGFVQDMNGQDARGLQAGLSAMMASVVVNDTTAPELEGVGLDLSAGLLTLNLSETVRASTVDASAIVVQAAMDGTLAGVEQVRLSNASVVRLGNGNVPRVVVELSVSDQNALKAQTGLAVSRETTYVSLDATAVQDMAGNAIAAVALNAGQQASVYVADDVAPTLIGFELDMRTDTAVVSLAFDETMQASTLVATAVQLQSVANASAGSSAETLVLSGGATSTEDATMLEITMTTDDLNAVKAKRALCVDVDSCYVSFGSGAVQDQNDNAVVAVSAGAGFKATKYAADETRPTLVNFSLDMDLGMLELEFSETIDASSFRATELRLQSDNSECGGRVGYQLTGGNVSETDSTQVTVALTYGDMNAIRDERSPPLGRNLSSTFLSHASHLLSDTAGNAVISTSPCVGIRASTLVTDSTSPFIVTLDADLDAREFTIRLSEAIFLGSIDLASFSVTDSTSSRAVSLLGSSATRLSSDTLKIALSDDVFNNLMRESLALSPTSNQLLLLRGALTDQFGNMIAASRHTTATFSEDKSPPEVIGFTLSVNTGMLAMTFSEPVDPTTLSFTDLSLSGMSASSISLSANSTVVTQSSDTSIVVHIGDRDLNALKLDTSIAISNTSTVISLNRGFIQDVAGNRILALAASDGLIASAFEADSTPPVVRLAALDVDLGLLALTFNEPIVVDTLNFSNLRLQDSSLAFTNDDGVAINSFHLTGGSTSSTFGTVLLIDLTTQDLNTIKRLRGLATRIENTFLTFPEATFRDMAGNDIEAVADGDGIQFTQLLDDQTSPKLEGFDVIMDEIGPPFRLRMSFTETVDLETFDATKVLLQDDKVKSSTTKQLRLAGGDSRPLHDQSP